MNTCSIENIPEYWEANDVITVLADLGMYHPSLREDLDTTEKEQEHTFKTEYFKKRFTLSRSLLKGILVPVLGADNLSDILLGKEKKGQIILPGRPDIGISLSYSGPCIAITVGKQKIGSDLEVVRPVRAHKIESCQIFIDYPRTDDSQYLWQLIHVWTLIESYAKLYDENPYPPLDTRYLFRDVHFVSYCINKHLIFSIASEKKQFTDALVCLDMYGAGESSDRTGNPLTRQ